MDEMRSPKNRVRYAVYRSIATPARIGSPARIRAPQSG
jgi:hypothetical protein